MTVSKVAGLIATFIILAVDESALAAATCANDRENTAVNATTAGLIDNGNGTVTDSETGLVWMRCLLGQSWDVDNCAGAAGTFNWRQALYQTEQLNEAGGFAGNADWRLPNKNELQSIAELRCWGPAVNASVFPADIFFTVPNQMWTSTPYAGDDRMGWYTYSWYIDFYRGNAHYADKNTDYSVRLVRGGR